MCSLIHTTSCFLFITTWLPPLKGLPEVNLERFVLGFQNNLLLSYPRCVENTQIFKGNTILDYVVNVLATPHHCIFRKNRCETVHQSLLGLGLLVVSSIYSIILISNLVILAVTKLVSQVQHTCD